MKRLATMLCVFLLIGMAAGCMPTAESPTLTEESPTLPSVDSDFPIYFWLDRYEELEAKGKEVKMGEIVFSEKLLEAIEHYPEGTIFGVGIVFNAVRPDGFANDNERWEYYAELRQWFAPCGMHVENFGTDYMAYAWGTKDAIKSMTCAENMAFYIGAPGLIK